MFNFKKTLNSKASAFFFLITVSLIVILASLGLYAFYKFSTSTAMSHVRTAAEIIKVHLTEAMASGTISQRQQFLQRLNEVRDLRSTRVVRAPVIDEQFGKVAKGEFQPDEIEKGVLRSGEPFFGLTEGNGELIFRGTIPYIATTSGFPDCLQCHLAKQGDVLGAVTMTMSVESLRHDAILTVIGIIGTVAVFMLLLFVLLSYLLHPISNTAAAVEKSVREALSGNFKSHIEKQTNDEIGQIADDMNRLLNFLDSGLGSINNHIAQLTERKPEIGENLLEATIGMVQHLTQISHYKLAIEEDESKIDIYRRLLSVLQDKFGETENSVYEIAHEKNEIRTIIVNNELNAFCRWCDSRIASYPASCRVFHTGRMVNGLIQQDICYSFRSQATGDNVKRHPLCFPILQSGSVGSILQLVVKDTDKGSIQTALPYIQTYLRETAPVLEARRLMETLRESSLRDPMTGLNNRRFLEEYIDTLVANVRRKQATLTVLMLDLDHFKMVNDTYGHDAGDTLLKELAAVMKRNVRASDITIRYGGEEFLIVLQDTAGKEAEFVAETIRASVEKMRINYGGIVLQKTISIGMADFPGDSDTFWQVVKYADIALYQAKETGRNRVVRYTKELGQEAATI
ncbi:MAG: diguanylate cyclase [Zoogloeaceae bacterium]|nr:diguanylate cyclase [Zoogloeaceae bacterium]